MRGDCQSARGGSAGGGSGGAEGGGRKQRPQVRLQEERAQGWQRVLALSKPWQLAQAGPGHRGPMGRSSEGPLPSHRLVDRQRATTSRWPHLPLLRLLSQKPPPASS